MGVTGNFFRPHPLERRKTPLSENICLFLLNFYKPSASEKISNTIKIDRINSREIKNQGNQVKKYIISLNKMKHLEKEQNGSQSIRTATT